MTAERARFQPIEDLGIPWQRVIKELTERPGISGALLLTRDGLCVINRCEGLHRPETVSAMAAAILAAGETLAGELSGGSDVLFKIETARMRAVGVAASDDLLVLAVADVGANTEDVFRHLKAVVGQPTREPRLG